MASTTELKALYEVKRFDGISVDFWKVRKRSMLVKFQISGV